MGYIDPNTGGMLFQALAASFAVLSGLALVFSRQIRAVFARVKRSLRSLRGRDAVEALKAESHADQLHNTGQKH